MKALVISGGGVKGAFTVGILKEMVRVAGIGVLSEYKIIAGTSTGSLIAPLASQGKIADLEDLYTNREKMKDYYKIRKDGVLGDIITDCNSVFNVDGLRAKLLQEVTPIFPDLTKDDSTLLIFSAVSIKSGELVYFSNKNIPSKPGDYRAQKVNSIGEMVNAIMASANQPVLAPPVTMRNAVKDREEEYVDGGVREYLPIQGAIDNGATDIDVIINSPSYFERDATTSLFSILQSTIDLLSDEVGQSDIRNAKRMVDLEGARGRNITMRIYQPPMSGYGVDHNQPFPFLFNDLDFNGTMMQMVLDKGVEEFRNKNFRKYPE